MVSSDLLDRLTGTDRLHGDSGLELGAVGTALAYRLELPLQEQYPASAFNDGACP